MSAPPPPLPLSHSRARRISAIVTICLALLYGAFFRWAFTLNAFKSTGGLVSLSFIWSVPFALGSLSVAIGRWWGSDKWAYQAMGGPALALAIGLVICIIARVEAIICVLMAVPLLFPATILGGVLTHFLLPKNRPNKLLVSIISILPILSAQLESNTSWPTTIKAIENTIEIDSSPEEIWKRISSVDAINPEQIPNRWIYRIGFPKPIAATLNREGVGGIRTATFERDVAFFEEITEWDYPKRLSFSIHADPNFIPHTAFDQHIIVGGRFYDVLDGIYEIERISEHHSILHLTSHHRLGTRFNSYAAWWSKKIMNEIQGSILSVIKERAEDKTSE